MRFLKNRSARILAVTLSALTALSSIPFSASALVTDEPGDYDNFAKALQYSLYFYDGNMCGDKVEENNRFAWRANCHTYDNAVPLQPIDSKSIGCNLSASFIEKYHSILETGTEPNTVDVAGGFHDAGDHVKFGLPEAYAGSTISWGYYEFRDAYVETEQADHVETIIRYFCDYFMKCTFRDDSGKVVAFCYQVGDGDIDHSYWQLPQNDTMARPAWFATADNPTTCNVAETAACLAINYLNFKDTDPAYADKCLDYAKALYNFTNENPKQIADTEQGPKGYYGSTKWEDDYCFAACWLYLITEDDTYLQDMLPVYDFYAPPGYVYCWNDVWNGVGLLMGRISETYKSGKTYTEKENPLGQSDLAIEYMKAAGKNPYEEISFWGQCAKAYNGYMSGSPGTITPQGYFWLNTWGSCRYNTAVQMCMLIYDKYTGGKDYYDTSHKDYYFTEWAKGQMEYILGNNDIKALEPGGKSGPRCFIVGFDSSSAKNPHHRAASGLTKCEDTDQQLYVLFGALAGGPDADDGHNDETKDWIYNEVTIDYNAACPGAAAGLYLAYKDQYKQAITPNFPPADDGGRGAALGNGEGGGGGATWVEACGIDDYTDTKAGVTKVSLMVKSSAAKAPTDLKVRYYFDVSEISDFSLIESSILYDQVSAEAAPAKATISAPQKWEKDSKIAYVELDWGDYNFANCGKKIQFKIGFYFGAIWTPDNDPSYKDLKIYTEDDAFFGTGNEVRTDNICVYDGDTLIGGIEPDGTEPQTTTATSKTTTTTTTTTKTTTSKTTTSSTTTSKTTTSGTTTSGNTSSSTQPVEDPIRSNDGNYYGDINCDGIITVSDAILGTRLNAQDITLNVTAQGITNSDCDHDGATTLQDVTLILKYVAKLITLTELGN